MTVLFLEIVAPPLCQKLDDFLKDKGLLVYRHSSVSAVCGSNVIKRVDSVLVCLPIGVETSVQVVQEVKYHAPHVPILCISESQKSGFATSVLRAGADDVVRGPLDFEEVYLRLQKRTWVERERYISVRQGWIYDQLTEQLLHSGEAIRLPPIPKKIFLYLLKKRNKGHTTIEELKDVVYGSDAGEKRDETIRSHIRHLKEKLGDEEWIQFVTGGGDQLMKMDAVLV